MSVIIRLSPCAFVVWWKDVERWSVGSFVETDWQWPASAIRPLSTALSRKLVDVDRDGKLPNSSGPVTLNSAGKREPREESAGNKIKAGLFHADRGEVFSPKIDVRNGAIGIVPDERGRVCVSRESPVYAVNPTFADAR